ncbi:ATP-binding protein [Paenibacillus sp. FA6]
MFQIQPHTVFCRQNQPTELVYKYQYFITAHDLVQTLQQAHQTNTMKQKVRMFPKADLLIIDEIGYRKMDDAAAHFFFQIISERFEKGSIILTSNKSYGSWGEIFGDTVLATAILDRLLHHSVTHQG